MPIILEPTQLKYLLIDSLRLYTEDSVYLSGDNPYCFSINKRIFHIFIHNVHDTGYGRPNEDECRIQFSRSPNFLAAKESGVPVIFLGYYGDKNVFTAWNPYVQTQRINKRQTVSVYSRFSTQSRARDQGLAVYEDNNGQVIVSFKPEYLGLYLENFETIHESNEKVLLRLIQTTDATGITEEEEGPEITLDRKRFTVTHRHIPRAPSFQRTIYEIYNERCAMCGIQLECILAAHIIPHSHELGTDDPTNGMCLCVLHHQAYDTGLIFVDRDYNIKVNDKRIQYLTKVKKDGGIQKFLTLNFEALNLPTSKAFCPSVKFIEIANKIRNITN